MEEIRLRAMTSEEFQALRDRAERVYAAAKVAAGEWDAEHAQRLAAEQTDALLPDGLETVGMLLRAAEIESGSVVGHVWVALQERGRHGAWIYDIEIEPRYRGRGYGRALLAATEDLVRASGVATIGLNVFAGNDAARGLYTSSGYEASSLHMHKALTP
jgi:ribosomal protein S18 acetylase RimI-like enzyme